MKLFFIGDIFGRPGRKAVKDVLKKYREQHQIDLVIANAENMRHGKGVSEENIKEMQSAGVDFFTSGNHIFKESSIIPFLDQKSLPLLRPANFPAQVPGRGYEVIQTPLMKKVLIINVLGRVFMPQQVDCPFRTVDNILKEFENESLGAIFIDVHAEATSEKAALAYYLDGRVSAVIGTHTHVPTADARILPNGTAFQTDVGFTGPLHSIIGTEKNTVIQQFLTQMPFKHEVASGPLVFNAVKITINDETKKATSIETFQEVLDE